MTTETTPGTTLPVPPEANTNSGPAINPQQNPIFSPPTHQPIEITIFEERKVVRTPTGSHIIYGNIAWDIFEYLASANIGNDGPVSEKSLEETTKATLVKKGTTYLQPDIRKTVNWIRRSLVDTDHTLLVEFRHEQQEPAYFLNAHISFAESIDEVLQHSTVVDLQTKEHVESTETQEESQPRFSKDIEREILLARETARSFDFTPEQQEIFVLYYFTNEQIPLTPTDIQKKTRSTRSLVEIKKDIQRIKAILKKVKRDEKRFELINTAAPGKEGAYYLRAENTLDLFDK